MEQSTGCNYCRPQGWNSMTCNICGTGSTVYASISIAVPHGGPYPYSSTCLCKACFDEYGIECALEHNAQCREDLMPPEGQA